MITIIAWVLTVATALFLGKSALGKITGTQEAVGNFAYMKLEKYRVIIGILEMLGAVLLLVPGLSLYGAILIACIMSGAITIHLSLFGGAKTYIPVLVALGAILGHLLK